MSLRSTLLPRRLTLVALAAGVLGLHLLLGQRLAAPAEAASTSSAAPPVQVRSVVAVVPAPTPKPTPPIERAVARVAEPARPAPPPRPVATPPAPSPDRAAVNPESPSPMPALAPPPDVPQAVLVATALPASAVEPVSIPATPDDNAVPVYRTQVPPSITLQYQMRRGFLSGTGELSWRRQGNSYEARLQGRVAGFSVMTWVSRGGFDRAGLAPTRFTDERRGKGEQAANFQRSAGKISYSGPSTEFPLLDGSQDRLSWMIQMAAIANADPQLLAPGGRIAIFVTGARGDADVWTFQVQGPETVRAGETVMHTVKLLREPRKPYDTRVEVWLDPAQHHLPVRARLGADRDVLELLLQSTQTPS